MQAAPSWPLAAIRRQVSRSIDVVIHLERTPSGRRRVARSVEVGRATANRRCGRCSPTAARSAASRADAVTPGSAHDPSRIAGRRRRAGARRRGYAPDRCRVVVAPSATAPRLGAQTPSITQPAPRPAVDGRSRRPRRLVRRDRPCAPWRQRRCNHALRSVAPPPTVDDQLAPAMLALERGASVAGAFADLQTRSPHLDLVVVVLRACAEHGGAAAEPIDRAASALRQRAALGRGAPHPERSGAHVGDRDDPAPRRHARHAADHLRGRCAARRLSPVGLAVIACGALLNLAGWSWMRRLIAGTCARDEPADRARHSTTCPTSSS